MSGRIRHYELFASRIAFPFVLICIVLYCTVLHSLPSIRSSFVGLLYYCHDLMSRVEAFAAAENGKHMTVLSSTPRHKLFYFHPLKSGYPPAEPQSSSNGQSSRSYLPRSSPAAASKLPAILNTVLCIRLIRQNP
jgi:hypothetical protein